MPLGQLRKQSAERTPVFCIFSIIHGKKRFFKNNLPVHKLTPYSLQFVHPDMEILDIIGKKETIRISGGLLIWLSLF